jgi:hypothetical protein
MYSLISLLKSDPNAANALGALAGAAAAFLALFVSALSVWISIASNRNQRRHNELSVRPLAEISVADFEDRLSVQLHNNGTGPLLVSTLRVYFGDDHKDAIIDWMPALIDGRPWTTFTPSIDGRSVRAGDTLTLLELTQGEEDEGFADVRSQVRSALSSLSLELQYTDIYENQLPGYQRDLTWFGRHEQ